MVIIPNFRPIVSFSDRSVVVAVVSFVRLPAAVEMDYAGLLACLSTISVVPSQEARVICIEDTMCPKRVQVSTPLLEEAHKRDDLSVVEGAAPLVFEDGDFADEVFNGGGR